MVQKERGEMRINKEKLNSGTKDEKENKIQYEETAHILEKKSKT